MRTTDVVTPAANVDAADTAAPAADVNTADAAVPAGQTGTTAATTLDLDEPAPLQVVREANTQNGGTNDSSTNAENTVRVDDVRTPAANKKLGDDNMRVWWSWLPLSGVVAGIADKIYTKVKEKQDEKEKEKEEKKKEDDSKSSDK